MNSKRNENPDASENMKFKVEFMGVCGSGLDLEVKKGRVGRKYMHMWHFPRVNKDIIFKTQNKIK